MTNSFSVVGGLQKEWEINLKAAPCLFHHPPGQFVFRGEEGLSTAATPLKYSFFGLYLLWASLLCWINTSLAETWPFKEMCGLFCPHHGISSWLWFHRCLPALSQHRKQPLSPFSFSLTGLAWFCGDLFHGVLKDNIIAASADSPRNSWVSFQLQFCEESGKNYAFKVTHNLTVCPSAATNVKSLRKHCLN